MSQWNDLNMDTKISEILRVDSHYPNHHFGRPFMTPYQIAIAFHCQFSQEFQTIGKPLGGKRDRTKFLGPIYRVRTFETHQRRKNNHR